MECCSLREHFFADNSCGGYEQRLKLVGGMDFGGQTQAFLYLWHFGGCYVYTVTLAWISWCGPESLGFTILRTLIAASRGMKCTQLPNSHVNQLRIFLLSVQVHSYCQHTTYFSMFGLIWQSYGRSGIVQRSSIMLNTLCALRNFEQEFVLPTQMKKGRIMWKCCGYHPGPSRIESLIW